ncbi:MAG: phage portal protein, partial [Pseudomonadota bacterium]
MPWPWQTTNSKTASLGSSMIALAQLAAPQWGGRTTAALIRDGYLSNAVAYRCVRLIAEAAASVPLQTDDAELAALLANPAPDLDGRTLLEQLYANLQISGNAFAEAV